MYFKLVIYVPNASIVAIYTFQICDSEGNIISSPTNDFLNAIHQTSPSDAYILVSQINDTANKYGILGRDEKSKDREGLKALPSSRDEEEKNKISSEFRLYYWVLNKSTIIIGGGCHKPKLIDGIKIKSYQMVPECENAAKDLSLVGNKIEAMQKKSEIFIEEKLIETDLTEIIKI